MPQKLGWCAAVDAKERGHFSFGAVSNTTARELIIDCNEVDIASVQVTSTGTLNATITVLASNSYIPDARAAQFGTAPAGGSAPVRAGSFVAITTRVTGIVNPGGAGGDCLITIGAAAEPFVAHGFVKIVFTPASGSGNLDMYVSGKQVGR